MKKYKYNKSFEAVLENIEDTTYGVCPAPMEAQQALDILADYLLGDNFWIPSSINTKQANSCVVEQILVKYSKQWKKDWKHYEKETKNK